MLLPVLSLYFLLLLSVSFSIQSQTLHFDCKMHGAWGGGNTFTQAGVLVATGACMDYYK